MSKKIVFVQILVGAFFLLASFAHAMEERPKTKILILGESHDHVGSRILPRLLIKKLLKAGKPLAVGWEGTEGIESITDTTTRNARSFRDLLLIQKVLKPILRPVIFDSRPIADVLGSIGNNENLLTQIKNELKKLDATKFSPDYVGTLLKNVDQNWALLVGPALAKNADGFPHGLVKTFERQRFYELIKENNIPVLPLETDNAATNAYSKLSELTVFSEGDENSQKVIQLYESYEHIRTGAMANKIFELYQQGDKKVIVAMKIGLLHIKRVAAHLVKLGVSEKDIGVFYLRNPEDLDELLGACPNLSRKLIEGLNSDENLRESFNKIKTQTIFVKDSFDDQGPNISAGQGIEFLLEFLFPNHVCGVSGCLKQLDLGSDELKLCTRCREVRYCSKECQISHWPSHKHVCKKT